MAATFDTIGSKIRMRQTHEAICDYRNIPVQGSIPYLSNPGPERDNKPKGADREEERYDITNNQKGCQK